MLKIAITGNIASGKSQVENIIKDMGYTVYDTDKIAHNILNNIKDFYGYDVFTNNKIDRKKLGTLVFSNPDIKKKLENMVHPQIKTEILNIFEKHNNEKFMFISVPLLFEAKFDNIFDKIILITVNKNTQIQRLMTRNNLTKEDALLRINSQIPQEHKKSKSDYIICNDSSIEELKIRVQEIISKINNINIY